MLPYHVLQKCKTEQHLTSIMGNKIEGILLTSCCTELLYLINDCKLKIFRLG